MDGLLLGRIFFGVFSAGMLALAIGMEIRWWRLRNATHRVGKVVDQIVEDGVDGETCYRPVIEVLESGTDFIRFDSSFGKNEPFKRGEEVIVLFDPETKRAEWYSTSNRLLPSLGLLVFAAIFGLLAVFSKK
jgi:hypothetical protein